MSQVKRGWWIFGPERSDSVFSWFLMLVRAVPVWTGQGQSLSASLPTHPLGSSLSCVIAEWPLRSVISDLVFVSSPFSCGYLSENRCRKGKFLEYCTSKKVFLFSFHLVVKLAGHYIPGWLFFFLNKQENCIDCFLALIVAVLNSNDILIPDSSSSATLLLSFTYSVLKFHSMCMCMRVCVCVWLSVCLCVCMWVLSLSARTFLACEAVRSCKRRYTVPEGQQTIAACADGRPGEQRSSPGSCGQSACQGTFLSPCQGTLPKPVSFTGFILADIHLKAPETLALGTGKARETCIRSIVFYSLNISHARVNKIAFPDKPPLLPALGVEPWASSRLWARFLTIL